MNNTQVTFTQALGKSLPQMIQDHKDLNAIVEAIEQYILSDERYIKAKQKVDYLQSCIDFLDRTIRQITNRTFTIKNAIDWRKFTSGAI